MGGGWSGLERLVAEFQFGVQKTSKPCSRGCSHEATQSATGIYSPLSSPTTSHFRILGDVWRTSSLEPWTA
jgi:hypothetical protein